MFLGCIGRPGGCSLPARVPASAVLVVAFFFIVLQHCAHHAALLVFEVSSLALPRPCQVCFFSSVCFVGATGAAQAGMFACVPAWGNTCPGSAATRECRHAAGHSYQAMRQGLRRCWTGDVLRALARGAEAGAPVAAYSAVCRASASEGGRLTRNGVCHTAAPSARQFYFQGGLLL